MSLSPLYRCSLTLYPGDVVFPGSLKYAEDVAFLAEGFEALGTSQDLETV